MQRRSTRSMKKNASPARELESSKPVRSTQSTRKSNLCDADSESNDSDQDFVVKKPDKTSKKKRRKITDSSSSESDIENYLKPADEIDLNSSFFKSSKCKDDIPSFDQIEKDIFSNIKVTRLSDSDSSEDEETKDFEKKSVIPKISLNDEPTEENTENLQSMKEGDEIALLNFQRLDDYRKKIEEAKKSVEQYQAKQLLENVEKEEKQEETLNIEDLLAIGETKKTKDESEKEHSASSSVVNVGKDPYSDSEQEDWEEIGDNRLKEEESLIPKKELEITVEMPSNMRKKKGNDLLAVIKRRLNRIRKENQLLIHKVHLLCWVAHGNYVNNVLNDQSMLSLGLSLMPSEKSFPSGRIDLNYLEQILKWFKKTVKLAERVPPKNLSLENLLIEQISKKEAYSKSMLAMIFITVLRSLGIQCRLVLSLQVEPIRPPNSDLHFLGNPSGSKDKRQSEGEITKEKLEKKVKALEAEKNAKSPIKKINLEKLKPDSKTSEEKKKEPSTVKDSNSKKERSDGSKKSRVSSIDNKVKSKTSKDNTKETSKYFKESEKKESGRDRGQNNKKEDKEKTEKTSKEADSKRKSIKQEEKESKASKSSSDKNTSQRSGSRQSLMKNENSKSDNKNQKSESKTKTSDKKDSKEKNKETKDPKKNKGTESKRVTRSKSKSPAFDSSQNVRSKSTSTLSVRLERIDENHSELPSKRSSSSTDISRRRKIPQLDGMDDSAEFKGFEESQKKKKTTDNQSFEKIYSQLYKEVSSETTSSKVNLKKLKSTSNSDDDDCISRKHRRSVKKPSYKEKNSSDSESDFEETPPKKSKVSEESTANKNKRQNSAKKNNVNLQKLKAPKSIKVEKTEKKTPQKTIDVRQDIISIIKKGIAEQKDIDKSKLVKKRKPKHMSDEEDSDYAPEPIKKKYQDSDDEFYPKLKVKKRVQVKEEVKKIKKKKPKDSNSRKVISSDSEYTEEEIVVKKEKEETVKKKRGNDTWLEVFLEMEEKWISVDVVFGQAHCVNELYSRASHPVSYVLAWNNNNHIKDITRRYCQNYNTVTRKLRIDAKWWEESLKAFLGPKNARDREEDDELDRQQQEKPLPTTISEYKNHPLYALERHLLKFEAIYPPNAAPLGYVRNEPVYSRDCVFVCHSRDIWLKEAKVVKRKEQPYKIVKARPKYDKLSNTMITDQLLEIFGPWQVEDYDPPTAENGIVPRNAFGNVDLFKPSMLPKKCVHLRLPGLNKTAKRLNIDCASAIIGFDFHGGWSHPVYDGFVVCEEYEDELVAAWNIEQEEQEKKDQEKYEKRVYGNWKKLIRGLMIRERLKAKYGFGQNEKGEEEPESSGEPKEKKTKTAKKNRRLISDSSDDE